MHLSSKYDVYIFDCDGVILDSNTLKLDAMRVALKKYPNVLVNKCIDYFSNNFGRSRYHHIKFFLDNILDSVDNELEYKRILEEYSNSCRHLYEKSEINSGFIDFVSSIKADKYVASGSDEKELQEVFKAKNIEHLFSAIYGSPESKDNNVSRILSMGYKQGVMFGDALGDLHAAKNNNVEFIFVSKLSLAPDSVRTSGDFSGNEINDFLDINVVR